MKKLAALVIVILALFLLSAVWLWVKFGSSQPMNMGPIVGLLGEVRMEIPREYVHILTHEDAGVEDGDGISPDEPVRKIHGMGIEVTFPEMRPVKAASSSGVMSNGEETIRILVDSGSDYIGPEITENLRRSALYSMSRCLRCVKYVEAERTDTGLRHFTPTEDSVDISKRDGRDGWMGMYDSDFYFAETEAGEVTVFIRCENMNSPKARCRQSFTLGNRYMADIQLSYRRELLPQWKSMQEGVERLLAGFAVESR